MTHVPLKTHNYGDRRGAEDELGRQGGNLLQHTHQGSNYRK